MAGALATSQLASASFVFGGSGGDAGSGGTAAIFNTAKIATAGDTSDGMVAQSVGGGGGDGGMAFSSISGLLKFGVTMGGAASLGSSGGSVTLTDTGSVATAGRGSTAILAQSVGGGGGNGVISATWASSPRARARSSSSAAAPMGRVAGSPRT